MARGSERKTSAQQTRANAARDGKCNSEGAVRKGRGIARRYQSAQSQRANGRETEKLNLRWHACRVHFLRGFFAADTAASTGTKATSPAFPHFGRKIRAIRVIRG